jgi:hypothetical protein
VFTAGGKKQGGISAGRGAGGKNALRAGCFWHPAGPHEKLVPCFFPPAVVSRLYAPALQQQFSVSTRIWKKTVNTEAVPKLRFWNSNL